MSKKLAEIERAALETRTEMVLLLINQLESAAIDMMNIVSSYPNPWHERQGDVAHYLILIGRSI